MNERELAITVLTEITGSGAYSTQGLHRAFSSTAFNATQRAFATELVNGSLRHLIYLDYSIGRLSKTPIEKIKPFILNTLRISAYQILFLTRVPVSAACNEAVKLVKSRGFGNLAGFVNALLRNIARAGRVLPPPAAPNYLSIKYSYPQWLVEHFAKELGDPEPALSCAAADVSIAVNPLRTNPETLRKTLEAEGMSVRPSMFQDMLRISHTGNLAESHAFKAGLFHVMGESSALAVKLLNPRPGSIMLDVCAAPGGKSMYAAYLMANTGKIYAYDIHRHKLGLMEKTIGRLGLGIIETGLRDGTQRCDTPAADYLLIDAPCSGLGLCGKRPDIKYTKTPEDITALAALQREILRNASRYLKPGGILVYSTCTISSAENLDNLGWFASNFPFETQEISGLPNPLKEFAGPGYIQIPPGAFGMDGFFIARLKRKE